MSLVAVRTQGSRLLRQSTLWTGPPAAGARRLLSTKNPSGTGLRRPQAKGRFERNASQPSPETASSSSSSSTDPHALASERIKLSSNARTPGTEAIASLTTEQKMSNFAMAGGLLAFVTYIFYYSMSAVGGERGVKQLITGGEAEEGKNVGFEEFLKEASEGRSEEEGRLEAERISNEEARELVNAETMNTKRMKDEGVEEVIVAASAEEAELEKAAGFHGEGDVNGEKKRNALWRRVVFFWKRD